MVLARIKGRWCISSEGQFVSEEAAFRGERPIKCREMAFFHKKKTPRNAGRSLG